MSVAERGAADAWYTQWVVHAAVIAVLLLTSAAMLVGGNLDARTRPRPDRPHPMEAVRLTGTTLALVDAEPRPRAPRATVAGN